LLPPISKRPYYGFWHEVEQDPDSRYLRKLSRDGNGIGLHDHHFVVSSAKFHQGLMCADFSDSAIFQNNDSIGTGNGAESVGNDEASSVFHERGHAGLNQPFAFSVEVTGRFIQDQDFGVG
jgi:hypothetical protein